MADVTYEIVEHDHGWAYKVGDTFSMTYPTRKAAHQAAEAAAREQTAPGETTPIAYETPDGKWREESARGDDRPHTSVKD